MKDGKLIEIPERKLETVLPALGRQVRIVKPIATQPDIQIGETWKFVSLDEKNSSVTLEALTEARPQDQGLLASNSTGRRIKYVGYACICKFQPPTFSSS